MGLIVFLYVMNEEISIIITLSAWFITHLLLLVKASLSSAFPVMPYGKEIFRRNIEQDSDV